MTKEQFDSLICTPDNETIELKKSLEDFIENLPITSEENKKRMLEGGIDLLKEGFETLQITFYTAYN